MYRPGQPGPNLLLKNDELFADEKSERPVKHFVPVAAIVTEEEAPKTATSKPAASKPAASQK
jgi:hypothetical protein